MIEQSISLKKNLHTWTCNNEKLKVRQVGSSDNFDDLSLKVIVGPQHRNEATQIFFKKKVISC